MLHQRRIRRILLVRLFLTGHRRGLGDGAEMHDASIRDTLTRIWTRTHRRSFEVSVQGRHVPMSQFNYRYFGVEDTTSPYPEIRSFGDVVP